MSDRSTWTRPDLVLVVVIGTLVLIGLDMVYSASYVIAHNNPEYGSDTYFLVRQIIWAAVGATLLLILQAIDYRVLRRVTVPLLTLVVVLLVAVLVSHFGHSAYGAQRWLRLGPLPPIEPSELGKLALVLYLADWLSRRPRAVATFGGGLLPFSLILATLCGLVVLEPDLGSAFVIAATAVSMFFIAGADIRHLALSLISGSAALVLAITGASYRSARIAAYLDPMKDPLGIGWNTLQAEIALGSGGIFGLGLGASRQKFYYLPNAHTDAIFAVIGEELGLIGTVTIVILFALIAFRGYRVALRAPDAFGALIAAGVTSWLVVQALINVAVVTATIPFTGIPLPFVSFGGSSLIVSLAAMGIVLNVSRQCTKDLSGSSAQHSGRPVEVRV